MKVGTGQTLLALGLVALLFVDDVIGAAETLGTPGIVTGVVLLALAVIVGVLLVAIAVFGVALLYISIDYWADGTIHAFEHDAADPVSSRYVEEFGR